ncbi:MAG: hypothetical protein ACKOFW_03515, partial [Planctomycetaceae bacterium]
TRPWTPAGLIEVGGAEGVGRAFLEETFQSDKAPPQYRLHGRGARRMLEALLPEVGSDIKGHRRSRGELIKAAGYEGRVGDADELLRILDGELKLITPVEEREAEVAAELEAGEGAVPVAATGYHLTHDYLVPSLRRWLEDLLGQTPEGRAKLLLRERSRVWNAQPLNRHLPTLGEHLQIRRRTKPADRSEPERRLLARAAVVHGRGTAVTATLLLGLVLGGWWFQWRQAQDRFRTEISTEVSKLETAPPADWKRRLEFLSTPERAEFARGELKRHAAALVAEGRPMPVSWRVALATLGDEQEQLEPLRESLLSVPSEMFLPTRELLGRNGGQMVGGLWKALRDEQLSQKQRLRAGMALAA